MYKVSNISKKVVNIVQKVTNIRQIVTNIRQSVAKSNKIYLYSICSDTNVWCFHRIHNKNATLLQLTTQKCGIYRQIVTNIRQIVANIVQKVTIIVQKVINIVQKVINTVQNVTKIVQLHLLLPVFKPVILITAPHVGRGGFERIRAEYIIKRHYVAESARRVSGGGGGGRGLEMYLKMRYKLTMYLMYLI